MICYNRMRWISRITNKGIFKMQVLIISNTRIFRNPTSKAYSEITYQAYDNQSNIQVSYDYAELDQLGRQYTENVNTGNGLSLNTQNLPQFTDNDFLSPSSQISHLSPVNRTSSNPQNDFLQVQQNQMDSNFLNPNSPGHFHHNLCIQTIHLSRLHHILMQHHISVIPIWRLLKSLDQHFLMLVLYMEEIHLQT